MYSHPTSGKAYSWLQNKGPGKLISNIWLQTFPDGDVHLYWWEFYSHSHHFELQQGHRDQHSHTQDMC